MAKKFVVAHRTDPNNVGDIASNPLQYFLKEDEYEVIDVANVSNIPYNESLPLIVGGGGLIGNKFMGEEYLRELLESSDRLQLERMYGEAWQVTNPAHQQLFNDFHRKYQALVSDALQKVQSPTAPRFVWGAGHNGDTEAEFTKIKWPKVLGKYKSVAIRDYHPTSRYRWVPCASCMHPALTKKYPIRNDVIFFEHKKQLLKGNEFGNDAIPRYINSGSNVEQTIELLGSANIVLTNSYHGAYWGTLLRKRVVLVGGVWSSKFKFLKHQPMTAGKAGDWKNIVEAARVYDTALDECRAANEDYWNEIKGSL